MNVDELYQAIEEAWQKLDIEAKQKELERLDKEISSADFWSDNERASKISKQAADLRSEIETWQSLKDDVHELKELSGLGEDVSKQLTEVDAKFQKNQLKLFFSGEYDDHDAVLSIQSGAGGRDAQDWANMLFRMYSRWADFKNFKSELLDESVNEDGGIKSATILISGTNVFGQLKLEHGVHRLVRKSPFNSAGSRETSFALVEVLPAIDEPDEVVIDDSELKVDTYRAGGRGGQSVNTTDSAVRLTHLPTGISVAIQNERSQVQNKETALKILRSRLAQLQLEQHQDEISKLKGPTKEAAWGNQIRNYVLDPYQLVKDARSHYETSDVNAVLDGQLDELIEAGLKSASG